MKWFIILFFIINCPRTGLALFSFRNACIANLKRIGATRVMKICSAIFALMLLAVPQSACADTNPRIACVGNLKEIDGAVYRWATENHIHETNSYSLSDGTIVKNLPRGVMPVCPAGGTYQPGKTLADWPRCTFHGSVEDMRQEFVEASRRQVRIQCAMGTVSIVMALFILRRLKRLQNDGLIAVPVCQLVTPSLMLVLGILAYQLPQYSLKPTYGIVGEIKYVSTAVFALVGFVTAIKAMRGARKSHVAVLGVLSVICLFLLLPAVGYSLRFFR